jgi:glycosyltransferase involved in cell wall biosynthesis
MKISVLVSTYNWPEALETYFLSLSLQTLFPHELVIADDGSGPKTLEVIEKWQKIFPFPVHHIWHEDIGFRRTVILNKALQRTSGDFIIQNDGDLYLHRNYIADQVKAAQPGFWHKGNRVWMDENLSKKVLAGQKPNFFSLGFKKRKYALYFPMMNKLGHKTPYKGVIGCNMAYFRKDIFSVNGYNEDLIGWGKEDDELVARFHNAGLKHRNMLGSAIVYHLYHKENSKDRINLNDKILQETVENKLILCRNGIEKK